MDKIIRNVIIFAVVTLVVAAGFTVFMLTKNSNNKNNSINTINGNVANNGVNTGTSNTVGASIETTSGDVQNVKLSVSGGTYILTPSVLKKDVPVRMEADLNTLRGCSRDVVISAFGVRKYVQQGDNIITFTPTQTGTIKIACSMNMYRGTFTVE